MCSVPLKGEKLMNITFKNTCEQEKIHIFIGNQKLVINPGQTAEAFCPEGRVEFTAQIMAFTGLDDAVNEFDSGDEPTKLKDRILSKLMKKFVKKIPEMMLDLSVRYEFNCEASQDAVVDLSAGMYSVCDGKIADFFELTPIIMCFARAESLNGTLRVVDVTENNRKKFLKTMRNLLLFVNSGLFLVDWFFFIPSYLTVKLFASHGYIKRLLVKLYNKPTGDRERILYEKEQSYEKEDNKGCLSGIIKVLLFVLIVAGLIFWVGSDEPDVIVSKDLQSVVCFDETFVRIDGGLPEDAEEVFLGNYYAYYPLPDGEYDSDSYYCYIYEDSSGARYMWLKDHCASEENHDKVYEDYENPLVYKSTGKAE